MFAIDLFLYWYVKHYAVFFLCFGKSRLKIFVLHCTCPAETDRAQTKTEGVSLQQDKTHFLREVGGGQAVKK